jgi:hypothetical protein
MHARFGSGSGQPSAAGFWVGVARLGLLFLPVTLLLGASLRRGEGAGLLWLGTLFQALACLLTVLSRSSWREPAGPALIMLYVIGLSWLVLGSAGDNDWYLHLSQAVLLVVPLGFFGAQCLRESGAPALRRARHLAGRLAARGEWPADLEACRLLPEVKALRESLHVDAAPALAMLNSQRPQVRVAALAALEYRHNWRPGQPQVVLHLAQRAAEPEVRAAAVNALANLEDRVLIEALAEFLHDPSPLVRKTATEALLWNTEGRWAWVRHAVRAALADPDCLDDGPLHLTGNGLTREVVADLTAWTAEKGALAMRAALTLGAHYGQVLAAGPDPGLVAELRGQLLDPHTPSMLRLELARLLHQHRELDAKLLRGLLDPAMPAPVRLIAVEALLAEGNSPEALAALHDLARLPNREIALATAEVVQRRLGVDLGLPRGQTPPPAVYSRQAADVARRVLLWANHHEVAEGEPAASPDRPPEAQWPSLHES